jgi:hypothetical protein
MEDEAWVMANNMMRGGHTRSHWPRRLSQRQKERRFLVVLLSDEDSESPRCSHGKWVTQSKYSFSSLSVDEGRGITQKAKMPLPLSLVVVCVSQKSGSRTESDSSLSCLLSVNVKETEELTVRQTEKTRDRNTWVRSARSPLSSHAWVFHDEMCVCLFLCTYSPSWRESLSTRSSCLMTKRTIRISRSRKEKKSLKECIEVL